MYSKFISTRYQQLSPTKMFFPPRLYDIYAFCKGLKSTDAEGSQSFKKKIKITHSRDLGKFKHNASAAREEAVLRNMKIYKQDALWQSYHFIANQEIPDSQ